MMFMSSEAEESTHVSFASVDVSGLPPVQTDFPFDVIPSGPVTTDTMTDRGASLIQIEKVICCTFLCSDCLEVYQVHLVQFTWLTKLRTSCQTRPC